MGESVGQLDCGPYSLLTDVSDERLLTTCARLGRLLEVAYRERYGLHPVGEPRGMILLFSSREGFARFVRKYGRLPSGYAGFTRASRGIVALHVQGLEPQTMAQALVHELTHLLHRRVFGPDMPPWLSEGLADGIGDTASADGIEELEGFRGVKAQRQRLLWAYSTGRARDLRSLVELQRGQFDRDPVSFDYEQSALLVRFLLVDQELSVRFTSFLARLAGASPHRVDLLTQQLGVGWEELESRFRQWLEDSRES